MCYGQFCGILLELILSGEWGESLGVEFLESCDLALPQVLLRSPSLRLRPLADTGCQLDLREGGRLSHTFSTSLLDKQISVSFKLAFAYYLGLGETRVLWLSPGTRNHCAFLPQSAPFLT